MKTAAVLVLYVHTNLVELFVTKQASEKLEILY